MVSYLKSFHNWHRLKIELFLLIVWFGTSVHAADIAKIPLFYPADKNKIQVLAPRFEYTVLDNEKIKIGDVLFDAKLIKLEILKSKENKRYRLRFTWPAGLVQEGRVFLLNNNGAAVWEQQFEKSNISIQKFVDQENPELRSDLAQMTSAFIENELFESIKYFPFMKFCTSFEQGATRLQLCSKEIYLSSQNGAISMKSRSSNLKKATITVNGETVEAQGAIYLNDVSQIVTFRGETVSGATLEIDTQKKAVDFRDFTLAADQKNLIIEANGAEPVIESNVERLANGNWRTTVPMDRPVVYMQGEGGIPLKQEFFIKAAPPRNEFRVTLNPEAVTQTYLDSAKVLGSIPEGATLSSNGDDDTLATLAPRQFEWSLRNLKAGESNRFFATVNSDKGQWVVAHDIYRDYSQVIAGRLQVLTPWNQASAQFRFEKWLERFVGLNSNFFQKRFGLGIQINESLSQKTDSTKLTQVDFNLAVRIESGLLSMSKSPQLRIYYSQFKFDSISIWSPGIGYLANTSIPFPWLASYFESAQYSIDYFLPGQNSNFKFDGLIRLNTHWSHQLTTQAAIDAGLILNRWTLPSSANVDQYQFGMNVGGRFNF